MKRKVLFVATVVRGHIFAFHLPYLKWFHEKGFEVHVAAANDIDGAPIPFCDVFHEIPFDRSPFSLHNIKAYRRLQAILKAERFEIVHCHTPVGGVLARLAAAKVRKSGTKVLYTAHGFAFYHGAPISTLPFRLVESFCARFTDLLITINREDFDYARRHLLCQAVHVHGVGVDTAVYHPSEETRSRVRTELGIKKAAFVLLCVGRLDRNKNHQTALRAAAEVIRQEPRVILLIAGEGPQKAKLLLLAEKLGVRENVRFLGYRHDVPDLLCAADALIHLSRTEGMPRAVMEAMACELPVIASNARGIRELIDETCGYLCRYDRPREVEGAIFSLLRDPKKSQAFGIRGREKIEPFTLGNTLSELTNCYLSVLSPKKKILHLLASRSCYGAEHVVCDIMEMFRSEQDPIMAYASPFGDIRSELERRGLLYYPMRTLSPKEFRRVLFQFRPDILHAHDARASVLAAMYPCRRRIVSTVHVNDPLMRKRSIKAILYAMASRRFSHIFWVNRSAMREYAFFDHVAKKSEHLPNIVSLSGVRQAGLSIGETVPRYDGVYIGRLEPQKDPHRLIRVMAETICHVPTARFAVIGDGSLFEEIVRYADTFGIRGNVSFLGYRENPLGLLSHARVCFMTSRFEGLPMTVLEAGALGVPVVAVPTDGIREAVIDGETGFLSDDDQTLAKRAAALISDDALYETMRLKALADAEAKNDSVSRKKRLRAAYFS